MIYAKTDWNNETLLDWDYDTMEWEVCRPW